jgi:hypothetical protein
MYLASLLLLWYGAGNPGKGEVTKQLKERRSDEETAYQVPFIAFE